MTKDKPLQVVHQKRNLTFKAFPTVEGKLVSKQPELLRGKQDV